MRKLFSLAILVLFTFTLSACEDQPTTLDVEASASHGSKDKSSNPRVVTVDLKEINNSGITGQLTIEDDGSTIEVTDGSATGLDPDADIYLSLFYDKASPPKGPQACEPGVHDPDHPLFLTDAQMLGAVWIVLSSDQAIVSDIDGEYVPIDKIGTVSIRDLRINNGFGPEAVMACGKVTHDPAKPNG